MMRSESPQVKTRPGLRISTRTHQDHYAITATHLLPSFHRCLGPPSPFPLAIYLLNRSKFSNYHNRPLALGYGDVIHQRQLTRADQDRLPNRRRRIKSAGKSKCFFQTGTGIEYRTAVTTRITRSRYEHVLRSQTF